MDVLVESNVVPDSGERTQETVSFEQSGNEARSTTPSEFRTIKHKGFARSLAKLAKTHWAKMKASVMSKVKLSLKLNALVQKDHDDFALESAAALEAVKTGASNVIVEAKSKMELKSINYLQQGDAEYYTEEAIKLRHSLRGDLRVVEQVSSEIDTRIISLTTGYFLFL
jgi:hypothetical protein